MDGFLTFFVVEYGIRQGCPISPVAFVLSTDLLEM